MKSRMILLTLFGAYILSFFHRTCPSIIALDLARDFDLSLSALSQLSAATMIAYGIMQVPTGILTDRLGGRRTLALYGCVSGLAAVLFAQASSGISASVYRFVNGVGLGVLIPSFSIMAAALPVGGYARNVTLLLSCGGVGAMLSTAPLAWLSSNYGWRAPMLLIGVASLALAAFIHFYFPHAAENRQAPAPGAGARPACLRRDLHMIAGTRQFWVCALWLMCMTGTYFAFVSLWWGPFLMNGCGLDKMAAGNVLLFGAVVMTAVQAPIGYISDVFFKSRKKPVVLFSLIAVVAFAPLSFFAQEMSSAFIYTQTAFMIMGMCAATPLVFVVIKESFPVSLLGTATGCANLYPVYAAVLQFAYGYALEESLRGAPDMAAAHQKANLIFFLHIVAAFVLSLQLKETYVSEVQRDQPRVQKTASGDAAPQN